MTEETGAPGAEGALEAGSRAGNRRRSRTARLFELLLVALLCSATFAGSLAWSRTTVPLARAAGDFWFDSDSPNVYRALAGNDPDRLRGPQRHGEFRSHVHPLYLLMARSPVTALTRGLGLSALVAIRGLLAACAALWILAIYLVLRRITERALDAFLFSSLALVGSAQIFWFTVTDTYSLGALTIALVLLAGAFATSLRTRELWFTLVGALSLGATITNWMFGVATAFANLHWKRAAQVCANALLVTLLAWSVQKAVYPDARYFLQRYSGGGLAEEKFILRPEAGGLWSHTRAFLFHSTVAPPLGEVIYEHWKERYPRLTFQHSALLQGSSGTRIAALVLWTGLLLWGGAGLLRQERGRLGPLRQILLLGLGGQFALHAVYGIESFLYSLHFQPLLILVVAFGARSRYRPVVLAAVMVLVPLLARNNLERFDEARLNLTRRPYLLEKLKDQARSDASPNRTRPRRAHRAELGELGAGLGTEKGRAAERPIREIERRSSVPFFPLASTAIDDATTGFWNGATGRS